MKKNMKYTLIALLAVFGLASCDENDYTYSAPELVAGSQVYFPTTNATTIELKTLDGEFIIPVTRIDTTQAINAKLSAKSTSDKYTVAEGVAFEAGQKESSIKVSYAGLEYDVMDTLTIDIDESIATPYGGSQCVLVVGAPAPWTPWCSTKADWTAAGMDADAWPFADCTGTCTYTYTQYFGGDDPGLKFSYRQNLNDPTVGEIRVDNWGGLGNPFYVGFNPATGDCTVAEQHAANHSSYGAVRISDIPNYSSKYDYTQFPCRYDAASGQFALNVIWFVDAGAFGNGIETIQLDGFYIPDYNVSVEFDGILTKGESVYAQVMVDFGDDAEAVKAYIAEKSDDATAVADALAAGDVEGFDVVKGINKLPLGDLTGELKVVIASIANGEAQAVAEAKFEYYSSGNASPWKSLGIGLYTDDILTPMFYADNEGNPASAITYEVEIKESTETPGLYRVMNPYGNDVYPLSEGDCAEDGYFLEIHAEDPEAVYILDQELGFDWGYGPMAFMSEGARYMASYDIETLKGAGYLGTLKDGIITLPVFQTSSGRGYQGILFMGNDGYYAGNGEFQVVLPSAVPAAAKSKKITSKQSYSRKFNGVKYQMNTKVNKSLTKKLQPVRL